MPRNRNRTRTVRFGDSLWTSCHPVYSLSLPEVHVSMFCSILSQHLTSSQAEISNVYDDLRV